MTDRGYHLHTGPRVQRVDSLTDEQRAAMSPHAQWWIRRALESRPADRALVEDGIRRCYAAAGQSTPEIVWAEDPAGGIRALRARGITPPLYRSGHLQPRWLAWVTYYRDVCGLTLGAELDARVEAVEAASDAGPWWLCQGLCVVTERASIVSLERVGPDGWSSHRLHSLQGPALAWPGGQALHYVHGVRVPARVVEDPTSITREEIDAESNAEVRRVMVDAYGAGRYAEESGVLISSELDEIGQPIRLYRREVDDDEPIVVVRLLNSTLEPDGTRREFWRRVPPTISGAREARNWVCQIQPGTELTVQT